jgi:hypothetical protein
VGTLPEARFKDKGGEEESNMEALAQPNLVHMFEAAGL